MDSIERTAFTRKLTLKNLLGKPYYLSNHLKTPIREDINITVCVIYTEQIDISVRLKIKKIKIKQIMEIENKLHLCCDCF